MLNLNLKLQDGIDNFNINSDNFNLNLDKQGFVLPKKPKRFVKIDFNKLIVNDKPIDTKIAK